MLAGRCLRLLRRPAALLCQPAPAAGRQLSALRRTAADGCGRLLPDTPPGGPPTRLPRRRPASASAPAAASLEGAARPGSAPDTRGDTVTRAGCLPALPPPPPPPPPRRLTLSRLPLSDRRLSRLLSSSSHLRRLLPASPPLSVPPRSGAVLPCRSWSVAVSGPPLPRLPRSGVVLPCRSGTVTVSGLRRAAPLHTAVWPDPPRRSFSGQPRERRRSVVQDMRRTGHQVRATVGRMVSHENIYTVPNALCVTRMALTPVIGWLVTSQTYGPALVCFVVAGVTDLLDGWIARRFPSQASLLGSFLDPLADKLLVATLFLSLTYTGLIPLGLTLLTVARDMGLIVAAAWVRYKSVPPPVTVSRYFDPTFATAQLEPTLISKFNTFLQISLVASTLAAPVLGFVDHTALRVLWCVTAGTTVTSGMVYALLQSSTYKLMERDDKTL